VIAPSVGLSEAERRQRLYDAVAHAIHATPRPLTLLLDDLQWCDRETLDLVYYIVGRTPPGRSLVVVGTVRTEEIGPEHPLHSLTNRLTALDRIARIDLRRLDETTTTMLAEQASGRTLTSDEAADVFQRTDGNPLFVLETLRHGLTQAESDGPVISPRVHAVIDSRLRQLSAHARELAALAATVGREFTIELLHAAADWSEETLLNTLDELWRRRIVQNRGVDRYDFTHDRIRDVAYLGASPVRRHELHVNVARALERLHAGDPAASSELAWHYDRGGHVDEAVSWYLRAARAAQMRSALEGVARPLRRAFELLDRLPSGAARDQRELEVLLPLGAALVAIGGYASTETIHVYRRAREVTERLGHPTPAPVARALALAGIATSDLDAAWSYGEELARAGELDGDVVMSVEGQYVLGVVAFWKGELRASRRHLERALESYRPERRGEHLALYAQDPQVVCLSRLSWTLWQLGHLDEAMRKRDDALALAEHVGDPHSYGYALWFTLFPVLEADDRSVLHEQIERLERVADEHRLAYLGSIAGSFAGYAATLRGDYRGGVERMEAALTDPRATGQASVLVMQTILLLARAHGSAHDAARALSAARSGLQLAEHGASVWKGELNRLVGDALIALGAERGEIEVAFEHAIADAENQGASWTALRAHTSLALWRAQRGSHAERLQSARRLAEALGAVEGGSEVPAVGEAVRLLELLR
jgi:tetratricopeptide (TPR) repeat protein